MTRQSSPRVTGVEYTDYTVDRRHSFVAIFTPSDKYRGRALFSEYQELHVFFGWERSGYIVIIERQRLPHIHEPTSFHIVGDTIVEALTCIPWSSQGVCQDAYRAGWMWDVPFCGSDMLLECISSDIASKLQSRRLTVAGERDVMGNFLQRALHPEDSIRHNIVLCCDEDGNPSIASSEPNSSISNGSRTITYRAGLGLPQTLGGRPSTDAATSAGPSALTINTGFGIPTVLTSTSRPTTVTMNRAGSQAVSHIAGSASTSFPSGPHVYRLDQPMPSTSSLQPQQDDAGAETQEMSHSAYDYVMETANTSVSKEVSRQPSSMINQSFNPINSGIHHFNTVVSGHSQFTPSGHPVGNSENAMTAGSSSVVDNNSAPLQDNLFARFVTEEVEALLASLLTNTFVPEEDDQADLSQSSTHRRSRASTIALSDWSAPTFVRRGTSTESQAVGFAGIYLGVNLIGATGELKVYYGLKKVLPNFGRNNWHSTYNDRRPPNSVGKADFTYMDYKGELTLRLLGLEIFLKWVGRYPEYHLEVKSTNGPYTNAFGMDANQQEQARQMTFWGTQEFPRQIYVLLRVSDLNGTPSCEAIIDPHWHIRKGRLLAKKVWLIPKW